MESMGPRQLFTLCVVQPGHADLACAFPIFYFIFLCVCMCKRVVPGTDSDGRTLVRLDICLAPIERSTKTTGG